MNTIGIRHEDKYLLERRTALVPGDIQKLINKGIRIIAEPSEKRIFLDEDLLKANVELNHDLSACDVILGVKEMPVGYFEQGKAYIFFSHVIKGQPYNMPMLRSLMDARASLIDYEKITDESGRRLIFFGRYAGLAGMINTVWTLGKRLEILGTQNPFSKIQQACSYDSLDSVKKDFDQVSAELSKNGIPEKVGPLIFGVTGDGNVSQGALEIASWLPFEKLSMDELLHADVSTLNPAKIYLVNMLVSDYMIHKNGKAFELQHYFDNPGEYENHFEKYLPKINVLVNGIYWDERYPRLVTKSYLKEKSARQNNHLLVIGDITCDPHGSIQCTEKATEIEDPVFIYHPEKDSFKMGFDGDGVAVMAVDILPSELPRDSSKHFSSALMPFMQNITETDFRADFENLSLAPDLKRAMIVHKGKLTPDYKYLEAYLK